MSTATPVTIAAHTADAGIRVPGERPVALIFANFGFYHLARMRALAERLPVTGIELAGMQKLYGWTVDKAGYNILTLFDGALEERRSQLAKLRSIVFLWQLLNDVRPRALLIPGYSDAWSLCAAVWGKLRRCRTVMMFESTEADRPRVRHKELLKKALVKGLFEYGFVGGRHSGDYLQKLGMSPRRIRPNYDVVDNAFFEQGADRLRNTSSAAGWNLPDQYFLYVGRLSPEKNLPGLLRAFRRYRARGGNWRLVLVGQGPQETELRSAVDELGIVGDVQFAGFRNGPDLLPYYSFASCFVLPSVSEPWGLVVNEAMAAGLPVLVSRVCGCAAELVEPGRNGYLFDPLDEDALADRLLLFASLPDGSRAAMGQASGRIVSAVSPAQWAESAVELLVGRSHLDG